MTPANQRLRGRLLASASLIAALAAANAPAVGQSLPTGGAVASGAAKIGQSGAALTINQTSARAVINWNTYSVGAGGTVTYVQPNAASATLNRVLGSTPSTIAGEIDANGQVYLVNPNGIAITKGGAVNVGGGFVASTLGIADSDFNSGNLKFEGSGASAAVSNAGAITVGTGGFVGLLGGTVSNSGAIVAPLGKVGLGSGEQATLDPNGDGFLQVAMPTGATAADGKALVDVSGKVSAAGGAVRLMAATAANAVRDAVNLSGYASVSSMRVSGGSVVLGGGPGGNVTISGRVSASGRRRGGSVAISGASVAQTGGKIDATGQAGAGGSVAIAATGGVTTAGTLDASGATGAGNVSIAAGAGTIAIGAASAIQADGGGGAVSLLAGASVQVSGLVTALGGPSVCAGGAIQLTGPGGVEVNGGAKLDASSGAAGGPGGAIAISAGAPSATKDGVVDLSGTLEAGAAVGTGGTISVTGRFLLPSGTIDASGAAGGSIVLQGGAVTQTGVVEANGATGAGGSVTVEAGDSLIQTASAVTSANGAGAGGVVTLTGEGSGNLFTSGAISATGATGGAVTLLGVNLTLAAATVDADGASQGGTIHVGGGPHGAGADTAQKTIVNAATTISADATASGDGGHIVIWSDQATIFEGGVSARGGASGGDGGDVEVSSGGTLTDSGAVDVSAPAGTAGTLLLDPQDIVISSSSGPIATYNLVDPDAGQGLGFGTEIVQLSGGTIVVTKPGDNVGSVQGAGSVFFYNSATGGLLATFQGASFGDQVGGGGLVFLNSTNYENYVKGVTPTFVNDTTANYLILSPNWSNGAGAITWVAANSTISGTLSSSNSLVGSASHDQIGANSIYVLPNNNYVSVAPNWADGEGAVTVGTYAAGVTGVVSAANSLVGSAANLSDGSSLPGDEVGSGGLVILPNGNFLVDSPNWNQSGGAVTFIPETGGVTGHVTNSNSLAGATSGTEYNTTNGSDGSVYGFFGGDGVGAGSITVLSNGYYVVASPAWGTGLGAVAVGNPTTGISGYQSSLNSLVGFNGSYQYENTSGYKESFGGDYVGTHVTDLGNGNFVVSSPSWNSNAGAVTFMSSTSPLTGAVGSGNSLVGSLQGNFVYSGLNILTNSLDSVSGGDGVGQTVTVLGNHNYVVSSPDWNSNKGAATFASGTTGITGSVSSSNSLVGTNSLDYVGSGGVTVLADNDYVVVSPDWDNGMGAVTRGSGTAGIAGSISSSNSIEGTHAITAGLATGDHQGGDLIGSGGITQLPNGDWIILSPGYYVGRGAVTLMTESEATNFNVSTGNSLVGSNSATAFTVASLDYSQFGGDAVGSGGIIVLSYNGGNNFLVSSPAWGGNMGAVTFENPSSFTSGPVSSSNSLVGANAGNLSYYSSNGKTLYYYDGGDAIGSGGAPEINYNGTVAYKNIVVLPNNNYVVVSPSWNDNEGAVTLGNGSTGTTGVVSSSNSLVGSDQGSNQNVGGKLEYEGGDFVGYSGIQQLTNSAFLIQSPSWDFGTGAVTWSNGTTAPTSAVSSSNSLVGLSPGDYVGYNGVNGALSTYVLSNGDYLVASPEWSGGEGAVTYGVSGSGLTGIVSSSNSLVGSSTSDAVGSGGVTQLHGNSYVILSPYWNNNTGAATWSGGGAITGTVSTSNSLTATSSPGGLITATQLNATSQFAIGFSGNGSGQVTIGVTDPTVFTYAYLSSADVTISPNMLTAALNAGTSITLQANNDITVNEAITTNTGSTGNLTLDAGRSVLINAGINTGNGNLTIVANDTSANGVVNASRDTGAAEITIASSSAISTGTGALSITMGTGAGNTNSTAGDITVGSALSGNTVFIANSGVQDGEVKLQFSGLIEATATGLDPNTGNAIVIETGGAFVSQHHSSPLVVTSGRWLLYSESPSGNTLGGVSTPNLIWGSTPTSLPPNSVSESGNQLIYAVANPNGTALTIDISNQTTTYGSSFTLDQSAYVELEGGVAGNYVTLTGLTISPAGVTTGALSAGTASANSYTLNGTTPTNSGYSFTVNTGTLTVQPLALTYSVANANSTYGATATLGNATLSGIVNSDSVTATVGAFTGSTPVTLTATTAASGYTEKVTALSNANYSIATSGNTNGTLTIAPKPLTYSVANANSTYGTLATLGTATLTGVVNGDTVTPTVSAYVGSTPFSLTATTAAGGYSEGVLSLSNPNYTVASSGNTNGTLTIAPKPLTYSVPSANSTYGTLATLGTATLSGVLVGDSVTGTVGAFTGSTPVTLAARTGAGSYTEEVTALSNANYAIASSGNTNGTLTIAPLALTYSVANANSTYGTLATLGTATLTGVLGGDSVTGTVGAFAGPTPVTLAARTAAGSYTEKVTGLSNANYSIASSGNTNGTLAIAQLALTYSVANANATYGALATLGTATLSGVLGGDSVTGSVGAFSGSTPVTLAARTAAGSYAEEVTGLSNANYSIASSGNTNGTLTIAPLALTYSVANANSTYGTLATLGTAMLAGVLGGDSVTATVGAFSGSTAVTLAARTSAGSYTEEVTGLSNGNYAIASSGNTNGTLTIAPLALTYSVANANSIYGTLATLGTATLTGVLGGDSVTGTVGALAGSTPLALTPRTAAGGYSEKVIGLSNTNYSIASSGDTNGTLTINPLALTYSVADATSTYGATAILGAATLPGVLEGDSVSATVGVLSGSTPVTLTTRTGAGVYTEQVTGLSNANYTIAPSGNTNGTLTIAPLALTYNVANTNVSATYGTTATLGTPTLTGVLEGDSVTPTVEIVSGSTPVALTAKTPAGTYAIEVGALSNANYTIAENGNTTGALTITPLLLTYSVANAYSTFGTTPTLGAATLIGVLPGDNVTATVGLFSGATPVALSSQTPPGVYSEEITLLSNANYAVAPAGDNPGSLTIQSPNGVSPAPLVAFASLPFIDYQLRPAAGRDFCGPQSVARHLHEHGAVDFGATGWSCR